MKSKQNQSQLLQNCLQHQHRIYNTQSGYWLEVRLWSGFTLGIGTMKSFPSLKRHHQDERNQSFFSILASPLWNILHVSYVNIHNNSNTTLFYCYFASAVVTTEFSQLTASSSDHSSLECSSTSSCGGGLAWYIQATSAVLTICILHHVYSVHLFYCTFVSSFKSMHLLSPLLITVANIPPVAYYPSKDVATYLSRSRDPDSTASCSFVSPPYKFELGR